jgi:hypothetical protein
MYFTFFKCLTIPKILVSPLKSDQIEEIFKKNLLNLKELNFLFNSEDFYKLFRKIINSLGGVPRLAYILKEIILKTPIDLNVRYFLEKVMNSSLLNINELYGYDKWNQILKI